MPRSSSAFTSDPSLKRAGGRVLCALCDMDTTASLSPTWTRQRCCQLTLERMSQCWLSGSLKPIHPSIHPFIS